MSHPVEVLRNIHASLREGGVVIVVDERVGERFTAPGNAVERELQLVKVKATGTTRSEIIEIADVFRAKIVDVDADSLTIEATGSPEKLAAMVRLLSPYGIRELVRSGMIAVGRGSRSMTEGSRVARLERSA